MLRRMLLLCLAAVTAAFAPAWAGPNAYIADTTNGQVIVIDTTTDTIIATVPMAGAPRGMAVSPDGSRVYAPDVASDNVTVIDTSGNTVIATIPVGDAPHRIAVSPNGTRVIVSNVFGDTVSVIDTATNTVIATIPVTNPFGVTFSRDGARAYVASSIGNTVFVIDTVSNTVVATIAGLTGPRDVAVSPDGTRLYVGEIANVRVIDTGSLGLITSYAGQRLALALSPDGSRLYGTNSTGNLLIADTATGVTTTVALGGTLGAVATEPTGAFLYVVNAGGSLIKVDTATNTAIGSVAITIGADSVGQFIMPAAPAVIPTLTEWVLIALGLMLAAFGAWRLRLSSSPRWAWSPDGSFLVYNGAEVGPQFPVRALSADGRVRTLPDIVLPRGARRLVFLPGSTALVVLKGDARDRNFWLVDLDSGRERQLTDFDSGFAIDNFDVSADGREIVFDQVREESDLVQIDLARR